MDNVVTIGAGSGDTGWNGVISWPTYSNCCCRHCGKCRTGSIPACCCPHCGKCDGQYNWTWNNSTRAMIGSGCVSNLGMQYKESL